MAPEWLWSSGDCRVCSTTMLQRESKILHARWVGGIVLLSPMSIRVTNHGRLWAHTRGHLPLSSKCVTLPCVSEEACISFHPPRLVEIMWQDKHSWCEGKENKQIGRKWGKTKKERMLWVFILHKSSTIVVTKYILKAKWIQYTFLSFILLHPAANPRPSVWLVLKMLSDCNQLRSIHPLPQE